MTVADYIHPGGLVLLLDWPEKTVAARVVVPQAAGVLQVDGGFLVCSFNRIYRLDAALQIVDIVEDRWFNNLHGLCALPGGYAVASAGIDSVIFLDESLCAVDYWCAAEHGYATDRSGRARAIAFSEDHRWRFYPTPMHTTHINSVSWDRKKSLLCATLFWQGTVVGIDRAAGEHGELLGGLDRPHSIQTTRKGDFLVANTGRGEIVTRSPGGEDIHLAVPGCSWLQDVKETDVATFLCADANRNRLLEIDAHGDVHSTWTFDREWKVHEAVLVNDA